MLYLIEIDVVGLMRMKKNNHMDYNYKLQKYNLNYIFLCI